MVEQKKRANRNSPKSPHINKVAAQAQNRKTTERWNIKSNKYFLMILYFQVHKKSIPYRHQTTFNSLISRCNILIDKRQPVKQSQNIRTAYQLFKMSVPKIILLLVICAAIVAAVDPVAECLGNCIACSNNNPLLCRPFLNATTGKQYRCLPYYGGDNCESTVSNYYNLYREEGTFFNWSLPLPPPSVNCNLISSTMSNSTSKTYKSIGPFSGSLNATKTLSFSLNQNIQKLIIKISVAVSDSALYTNSSNSTEQQTIQTVDEQGNIVIQTITTNSKNNSLTKRIPFLIIDATDQLNSNLLKRFTTNYQTRSQVQTSCGFIYQYQFEVQASSSSNPLRQILINYYLSSQSASTSWYLLKFSVEGGCSGFSATTGQTKCSTCLSGFYPEYDPDNNLNACQICDYRCSTCDSANKCLLCEKYTTSSSSGICNFPSTYKTFRSFNAITGSPLDSSSLSSINNLMVSKAKVLNAGLNLSNDKSYFIKFHLLYSLSFAQGLKQINITVNGKPHQTLSSLNTFTSTLLKEVGNGDTQLFIHEIKIDLMGKPCLSNFSIGLVAESKANEEFYLANLVLIQYSCVQNCDNCTFDPSSATACAKCNPYFSLADNCKTCANGFYLRNATTCVKCYSNCKQCSNYSMTSCTDCLTGFEISQHLYQQDCINCLYSFANGGKKDCKTICGGRTFTVTDLKFNSQCKSCLQSKIDNIYSTSPCQKCWIKLNLASGKCNPKPDSLYTFYSSDLGNGEGKSSFWSGNKKLSNINCTSDYVNLLGISQEDNHTVASPASLKYSLNNLPHHRGLIFVVNIYKIGTWLNPGSNSSLNIKILASAKGYQGSSSSIILKNSYGAKICSPNGNEMIWAVQQQLNDHISEEIIFTISSPDSGLFVREVQIYLGNCPDCDNVGLSFSLFAIPMYSDNKTQTGVDVWITFNKDVYFNNQGNQTSTSSTFAQSFRFTLDGKPVTDSKLLQNRLKQQRYLKYFVPTSQSHVNNSLQATTSLGYLVYSKDSDISRELVSSSQILTIQRFNNVTEDNRKTISQLSIFFNFFTWFTLIVMIVTVLLGLSVIFQEFSIMLQIIYLHIYITSWLLPASVKIPLSNATRMEHLNYFSDIASIQHGLFGNLLYPAEYIFQQYNVDVFFIRSIYPILFINLLYIVWFFLNLLANKLITACRESQSKVMAFCRTIPSRPISYFDQIWRYQFLAVMWACLLQFSKFQQSNGGQAFNLAICVLVFTLYLVWPFVITIYTYRRHFTMNVNHFVYLYHDIYYLKISSVADEPKYYLYVCLRFLKYFAYAVFISMLIYQSIIGPVLLIFFNIIEAAISYFLQIYRSSFYLFTRVLQNLLLIISAILCLILYGFSDKEDTNAQSYESIGYGLITVFILMVINGVFRFIYLGYRKIKELTVGSYDIGEMGEKQNYDGKSVFKLPESERS